jgi:MoaA/NifB/PqqE/SkfB family radical SAM enzyme
VVDSGIPYAAFGGGEPLQSAHCWEIFDGLAAAGVGIKLETDGSRIDDAAADRLAALKVQCIQISVDGATAADRLAALKVQCIQISVDGATAATHERVRPGSSFAAAAAAIAKLVQRGLQPQLVFTPTSIDVQEIVAAYDLAASMGCSAFVTGPLMRIGRAAVGWDKIACSDEAWRSAVDALTKHVDTRETGVALSVYPWDILTEMRKRLESPQAMLLMVPNGKVKLLNALPFAPADLRRDSLDQAWAAYRRAWRSREVREFVLTCQTNPQLLTHANETWPMRGH